MSVYSFTTGLFWSSTIIVILYLLRRKAKLATSVNLRMISLLYILTILRVLLPFEPDAAIEIGDFHFLMPILRSAFVFELMPGIEVKNLVLLIWGTGTVYLLVHWIKRYRLLARQLANLPRENNTDEWPLLKKVQTDSGKKRNIELIISKDIPSPMSFGIKKKQIFIPKRAYSDQELYLTLYHEYMHHTSHDLLTYQLCHVFQCMLWWNPVVYLLVKDLEQTLELQCDQKVTQELTQKGKISYLSTLLDEVKQNQAPNVMGTVNFLGTNDSTFYMQERFDTVAKLSKPKKRIKMVPVLLVATFIASYMVVLQPAYEAPIEEIETDGAIAVDSDDVFVVEKKDGSFVLQVEDKQYNITKKEAEEYIKYHTQKRVEK